MYIIEREIGEERVKPAEKIIFRNDIAILELTAPEQLPRMTIGKTRELMYGCEYN